MHNNDVFNCLKLGRGGWSIMSRMEPNEIEITKRDLAYYNSGEFIEFYRVARNYGTRSLNIDNNSVFFLGVRR